MFLLSLAILVGEFLFIRNCIRRNFKIWIGIIVLAVAFLITVFTSDVGKNITTFHIVILIASALFTLIYDFLNIGFWKGLLAFIIQVHFAITFFLLFFIVIIACVQGKKLSIDAADREKRDLELLEERRMGYK